MNAPTTNLTEVAADIAAAYLSNNTVALNDVPSVINTVYTACAKLGQAAAERGGRASASRGADQEIGHD